MLTLSLVLGLLLLGASRGIAHGVMDVTLGYVPGSGIPVWVHTNLDAYPDDVLTRDRLAALGSQDLPAYPYQEDMTGRIALPGTPDHGAMEASQSWHSRQGNRPVMWAVQRDDPLWLPGKAEMPAGNRLERTVVLDRPRFEAHFHCDAYARIVTAPLPQVSGPAADASLWCLSDDRIWLQVKDSAGGWELAPFHIRWARSGIRTFQPVDMLLPLAVGNATWVAGRYGGNPERHSLLQCTENTGPGAYRVRRIAVRTGIAGSGQGPDTESAGRDLNACLRRSGAGLRAGDPGGISMYHARPACWSIVPMRPVIG